jgi:diacylglycerol kinase family enzyme
MKQKKLSQGRVAFLLNQNAKSVTKHQIQRLASLIPTDDLYYSKNLSEAEAHINTIMSKGYSYIFSGGGDGTVVSTINLLSQYALNNKYDFIPRHGVLRLGTGNALARMLGAQKPEDDIKAILEGKNLDPVVVSMVETAEGQLTPFAGIGYDGELMNDFETVKKIYFGGRFRKFFSSFLGFTVAGIFKTLPRQAGKHAPIVTIKSSQPSYRIINIKNKDEEIYIEEGSKLYHGIAPLICVGTIASLGYGITMFPFAYKRPGFMHLRIAAVPIPVALANLYPSIWQGTFRHPQLFDFLVKDVTIESNEGLPYQCAGDAMGYKKKLFFKICTQPVAMAALHASSKRISTPPQPLLTPL